MNSWKDQVRFHSFVLSHPELEDEIKSFYQNISTEYKNQISKIELEEEDKLNEEYDRGYDNGKLDKAKEIKERIDSVMSDIKRNLDFLTKI